MMKLYIPELMYFFLFGGLSKHDEIFVTEANLVLGERKVVAILRVFVHGLFVRADSPTLLFLLFGGRLNGVFIVFGTVRVLSSSVTVLLFLL